MRALHRKRALVEIKPQDSEICNMHVPQGFEAGKEQPINKGFMTLLLQASSGAEQPLVPTTSQRAKQLPQVHLKARW